MEKAGAIPVTVTAGVGVEYRLRTAAHRTWLITSDRLQLSASNASGYSSAEGKLSGVASLKTRRDSRILNNWRATCSYLPSLLC
jgi:hypothetical protein